MAKTQKSVRHLGRQTAFQVLYSLNFQGPKDRSLSLLRRTFAYFNDLEGVGPEASDFAWELIQGVWENLAELDRLIGQHSQHWRVGRIAKIELSILRLALYELYYRTDIPLKVAINEGIELAKEFGDEQSRGFVNGILDAAAKKRAPVKA
jgi:N utilization substance protein B